MKIKQTLGERIFNVFNVLFMLFLMIIMIYPIWYVLVASFSDPGQFIQNRGILQIGRAHV